VKILYHHRTQAEDGQAVHIRSMMRALAAEGHDPLEVGLVVHGDAPKPIAEKQSSRWGLVTRMPRFLRELAEYGYNSVARRRILRAALYFEPDVIYERYAFGNASGILAAKRLDLPLILEVNSPLVYELERTRGLSFPGLARKLENFIYRNADRVCVVTEVLKGMLVELGVEPERIFVTPNGVDLADYSYADRPALRRAAREDLGLPAEQAGEVVIGFVGYYRDWHRLDVVLSAMGEPGLERSRLVLIGEGPARAELEAEAARLGLAERVHFSGTRPHARIPGLLPSFDVAVVPAINDYASPLKLHEYMAASLPVVAPDQANLREVLEHAENALLVPPGDADAMAQAVLELARDEQLRARLGLAARQTIESEDLTWNGNARRVVQVFRELLGERNS